MLGCVCFVLFICCWHVCVSVLCAPKSAQIMMHIADTHRHQHKPLHYHANGYGMHVLISHVYNKSNLQVCCYLCAWCTSVSIKSTSSKLLLIFYMYALVVACISSHPSIQSYVFCCAHIVVTYACFFYKFHLVIIIIMNDKYLQGMHDSKIAFHAMVTLCLLVEFKFQ